MSFGQVWKWYGLKAKAASQSREFLRGHAPLPDHMTLSERGCGAKDVNSAAIDAIKRC